ncbi:protoporphyrinogen oxidase [Terriglobus roseus DSM 18391]|uniref:Protoporphyrinogen oxidase n=1 Tax=Terriglobus roseus (strain DSM 18391 / NRRL B-41598 / KBS 63) TaxID=926566 RepID=I3ZEA0_TERRK|nr:FAD-dependent oxidoreductase [Terriglobus roseus]AFL87568.1 protoporphyrinogen oxidase [Terriglobus roseus DSM 18391]
MTMTASRRSHIAVVGAGFTGMVCALRLLRAGYRVSILEQRADIGGLSTSHDFGSFEWDRFYHCILTSDRALLDLLDELGLHDELRWTKTEVGLYSHGGFHKMTGAADLLRYRHLSLLSKMRLAIMSLYVTKIKKGLRLERVPLCEWTRRLFGRKVFEQIWEPLLRCKLGELRRYASAAFLWGTMVRLASTRQQGLGAQEQLGYVRGGYRMVFQRLQQSVAMWDGSTHLGVKIRRICAHEGDARAGAVRIDTGQGAQFFDGAVLTVPNSVVGRLLQTSDADYMKRLGEVMYLGMICVVVVLRRRLSPFYVTNVTDTIGFTGVIEMTNLIDPAVETNGRHLVYVPRYTTSSDPLFEKDDQGVWDQFWPELSAMYPDLKEAEIERWFVFRERNVQPVPTIGYSGIVPPVRTPVPNVYLANTAQIINNTLNNNAMTSIANQACCELMKDIPVERSLAASGLSPCVPSLVLAPMEVSHG